MRTLDTDNAAALAAGSIVARNLISITAKDFTTGDPVTGRFWDDVGTVAFEYVDGETLETTTEDFAGAGSLLSIPDIPFTSTIEIRSVQVTLSQVNDTVADLVRGYNLKNAPAQIHRIAFDPVTRDQVGPAYCRLLGFVDAVEIVDPIAGNDGQITLTIQSHTRQLTRASTDKTSSASQKLRLSNDTFCDDMDVVPDWTQSWGQTVAKRSDSAKTQTVTTQAAKTALVERGL